MFVTSAKFGVCVALFGCLAGCSSDDTGGGGAIQLPVLTLPGIAGIALTLGMAVDSNVLIFERIREESTAGRRLWATIEAGYGHAFITIIDTHVTTLLAGIIMFYFGSGPIRGFAVVHCLGIITSMFSSVLVSRMLTNFIYGRRRKLEKLAIGQIWKPQA